MECFISFLDICLDFKAYFGYIILRWEVNKMKKVDILFIIALLDSLVVGILMITYHWTDGKTIFDSENSVVILVPLILFVIQFSFLEHKYPEFFGNKENEIGLNSGMEFSLTAFLTGLFILGLLFLFLITGYVYFVECGDKLPLCGSL